jgi:hypothetical protein
MELVDVAEALLAIGGRGARVEDVEEAVRGVVRIKGHRQEAAHSALGGEPVDVEELVRDPVVDDLDVARAVDDEQTRVARWRGDVDRVVEVPDRLQTGCPGALRH